jgi:hypothetical protein
VGPGLLEDVDRRLGAVRHASEVWQVLTRPPGEL